MRSLALATLLALACSAPSPRADTPPSGAATSVAAAVDGGAPATPPSVTPPATAPGDDTSCVATRGCEQTPAPPTVCATVGASVPVAEVLRDALKLEGKKVSVRGALRAGARTCTSMACRGHKCCNRCSADVLVAVPGKSAPAAPGAEGLVLDRMDDDHQVFRCFGDESQVCCAVDARDQDVLATGTLSKTPEMPARWRLERAEVCVLSTAKP